MVKLNPLINEIFPPKIRILIYLYFYGNLTYQKLERLTKIRYDCLRKYVNLLKDEGYVELRLNGNRKIISLTKYGKEKIKHIVKYCLAPISLKEIVMNILFVYSIFFVTINIIFLYLSYYNILYVIDVSTTVILIAVLFAVVKLFAEQHL